MGSMEGAGIGLVIFSELNARALQMYPVLGYCVELYGSLAFINDCVTYSASVGLRTRVALNISP